MVPFEHSVDFATTCQLIPSLSTNTLYTLVRISRPVGATLTTECVNHPNKVKPILSLGNVGWELLYQ